MPIAKFEMPDGRVARFEVPEGATPEQVEAQAQAMLPQIQQQQAPTGRQPMPNTPPADQGKDTGFMSQASEAIKESPTGSAIAEFTSAVNRGAVNLLDFLGPDQINNILQMAGSEQRIPTLGEQGVVEEATTGQFMEPGLAKEAVRTAGEYVAPAMAGGVVLRQAAGAVPKTATPTTGQRILQGMTASPGEEMTAAALAGAGSEIGAEVGETVGGEQGRQIGGLLGGVGAPVAANLAKETAKTLSSKTAKKLLREASPSIEGLKSTARNIYQKIDELGASVKPAAVTRLSKELKQTAREKGFNPTIHPKVNAALREFEQAEGQVLKTSELDVLRRVAQSAASSADPDEKRLGGILISKIDDFMDDAAKNLTKKGADVGRKYRDARQLWRRAKKAETLEEAFNKAQLQASGFENGIRVQFRSILNSPKKRRGFTEEEIKAMRRVVEGDSLQNIAKALGKFGFNEGQATNMLMGSLGVAGGAYIGGPGGAVAVPVIGQVSRRLAQKLTRNAAQLSDDIVRAGPNGKEIVRAYMKATRPQERSSQELAELLLRPGVTTEGVKGTAKSGPAKKLVSDAVFLTNAIKSQEE